MAIVIVTGSAGLIGAEASRYFHAKGLDVVGIDNDMRRYFFGDGASTRWSLERLARDIPAYRHHAVDIRDAAAIEAVLDTSGIPDPDLVIRTSGEQRLSNFLTWQTAYAEYVIEPGFWPDFDHDAFLAALSEYHRRDRRFGGAIPNEVAGSADEPR
mgnify:CR=1 FL=1